MNERHDPRPRQAPVGAVPSTIRRAAWVPTVVMALAVGAIHAGEVEALIAQAAPAERAAAGRSDSSAATEWSDARTALREGAGKLTLGSALATLLGARSPGDLETLERFEKSNRGLPWKSALALGVGDGYVYYGWAAGERAVITATGNAERDCRRLSRAPCAVVLTDGKFDEQAFATFTAWLGTRPQAQVREDLLNKIRTNPYQGGVGSIERQP